MTVLFKDVRYLADDFSVREGCVAVAGRDIVYIGEREPEMAKPADTVIDGRGKMLLPGLFNTHTHLSMELMRGYGENLSLQDWLFGRIFPFEAKLSREDVYWGVKLAIAESLRFGVVSSTDMYMGVEDICRAAAESDYKLNAALMGAVGVDKSGEQPFSGAAAAIREWHGYDEGRIKIDAAIHAEYTTDEAFCRMMSEVAAENGLNMHLHLSETASEHKECQERHDGMTPLAWFAHLGVLKQPTTAAHCVWVDEADIALMTEWGVTAAHNPVSNLKLASGIAPVPQMLAAGVNVTLGTDSSASNNNQNLWEEIKLMAILHKATVGDPTVVMPREVLAAATINGALSQGRLNSGSITVGKRADLQLLDIDKPHLQPCYDWLNNLVFAAQGSDVVLTMVDGRILYRDGEYTTLDVEKIVFEVDHARKRILREI